MTWRDPRRVLREHGLSPKRSFGQNFLVARGVVDAIVAGLAPGPGDLVIEIGAGLGTLTRALCEQQARVVAIERDRDMAAVLRSELGDRVEVQEADAATLDLRWWESHTGQKPLVAGNLPYQITGILLRRLVEQAPSWRRAVLMVQREVAQRLVAPPGGPDYGALTVFCSARCETSILRRVSPGSFHPAPKVWSAVVSLVPRAAPRAAETPALRGVVRAAFEQRRKILRNALGSIDGLDRDMIARALAEVGIEGRRRGETLSVEELAALAGALVRAGWSPDPSGSVG